MPNWEPSKLTPNLVAVPIGILNTQFRYLTPNLVAHQLAHHSCSFLSFPSISSTSTAIHSPGPLRGVFLILIKFGHRRRTFVSNLDKNGKFSSWYRCRPGSGLFWFQKQNLISYKLLWGPFHLGFFSRMKYIFVMHHNIFIYAGNACIYMSGFCASD